MSRACFLGFGLGSTFSGQTGLSAAFLHGSADEASHSHQNAQKATDQQKDLVRIECQIQQPADDGSCCNFGDGLPDQARHPH